MPPQRPRTGAQETADKQEAVPSEAFLRRIHATTRRAFPAAPPVSSTASRPKSEHIDALSLELWARGDLPDRRYFDRWKSHMAACGRCRERLRDADQRRAG
jgi:hypothetical protein